MTMTFRIKRPGFHIVQVRTELFFYFGLRIIQGFGEILPDAPASVLVQFLVFDCDGNVGLKSDTDCSQAVFCEEENALVVFQHSNEYCSDGKHAAVFRSSISSKSLK
jgi:hypothetical protein